jgi:hypothetical protein
MIISLRHPHTGKPARGLAAARRAPRARRTRTIDVEQQYAWLRRTAVASTRGGIILLGLLSLRLSGAVPDRTRLLLVAIALAGTALALGLTGRLSGWKALSLDSLAVALLLHGTDRPDGALLPLTMLLILQGGLLGESNGALAGSAAGVALLIVHNLEHQHPHNAIAADLALLQIAGGLAAAWLWRHVRALLTTMRDGLGQHENVARELDSARQFMSWQRLSLQIAACTTIGQLVRLATGHAQRIGGAAASIAFDTSAPAGEPAEPPGQATIVPIACGETRGALTLYRPAGELTTQQRDALDHLALLVGHRASRLRDAALLARQQAALTALWEISGLLRVAPGRTDNIRDALGRLAAALELDWLALLAPDERSALAPLLVARGRSQGATPMIHGAQIRVAAEALRGERPLVRVEGAESLVCLPVHSTEHTPFVIAARGDAADAASQMLLLLFGDLIAGRLTAERAIGYSRVALA